MEAGGSDDSAVIKKTANNANVSTANRGESVEENGKHKLLLLLLLLVVMVAL